MRNCILLVTLIVTLADVQLNASPFNYLKPEGFYISALGGASIPDDVDYQSGTSKGKLEFNGGMSLTAAVGHHFLESWRIELEYSYRTASLDSRTIGGVNTEVSGDLSQNSLMMNFIYDVNLNYHFFWYGGAGLGFSLANLSINNKDDSDLVFSQQMMTGFGYRLSQKTSFVVGYRLFYGLSQKHDLGGVATKIDSPLQHIFELGIRYDF